MPKLNKLTPKQQSTIEYYCNPASETFNNLLQSMVQAGYTEKYAHHRGWQLLAKDHILAAMADFKAKIYTEQAITIELQQQKHARLARLAEQKGDLATATRNEELIGKTIGAYQENIHTTSDQQRELDEKETAEARRIASIRLREGA